MSWHECTLGDLITLKRGHDLPNGNRIEGNIPVVSSSGITGYHNEAKAKPPGVVTGRYGTLGEVFYLEQDYWPLNTALYVIDFKDTDPRFSAYFLKNTLRSYKSDKAAVPGVDRNVLHALKVRAPDRDTQERIVEILSGYDDFIENNKRRIELLEESARQLYKEWFVRFRFPGHEHVKIIDGVPEGWGFYTYGDVSETVGGGTPSTSVLEYWEGGDITWFVPKDLTQNDGLALLNSEKKITKLGLQKSSAKLLPPNTIMMSSRASIGYFGLYDGIACTNQGFISVIPNDTSAQMYLLYNLMSRKEEIIGLAGGTTYKEINKTTFRAMPILMPPSHLLIEFQDWVKDAINQVRLLMKQKQQLVMARDLLLPKLVSGVIAI